MWLQENQFNHQFNHSSCLHHWMDSLFICLWKLTESRRQTKILRNLFHHYKPGLFFKRTTCKDYLLLQLFRGCVYVYREKFVVKYDLHPLKAAGLEGTQKKFKCQIFYCCSMLFICCWYDIGAFGLVIVSFVLVLLNFIHMPSKGVLSNLALGPEGRYYDY